MSERAFLIQLRFLDGRYHGVGDWPPSPFRLFQALVAAAYGGRWRVEARESKDAAFRWLERLSAPVVVSPPHVRGRAATSYVPNNDADTIGGDLGALAEIRVAKQTRPMIFPDHAPFMYAWKFEGPDTNASCLCDLAERLHTVGRGVDAAFASAEVAGWEAIEDRLRLSGAVARPTLAQAAADGVRCPTIGSFKSLAARHEAMSQQFETRKSGRSELTFFRRAPKPLCRPVVYECPPSRLLFDLRRADNNARTFRAVPQKLAVTVATAVRDLAVDQLRDKLPERATEIESSIVGRRAEPVPSNRRVRIVPLPSIGMRNTDPSIRRVMIEVPPDCPVTEAEISWALSGQEISAQGTVDSSTGAIAQTILVAAEDSRMLGRYGIGTYGSRRWHTVTPAALPPLPQLSPIRESRTARTGSARASADRQRCGQVINALRHAGFDTRGVAVHVQREPFLARGLRADMSASGRFDGSRLHHVEITFPRPVPGPVILGDGRWLGLGLMAPVHEAPDNLHVFAVEPKRWRTDDGMALARALRRAVMARAAAETPDGRLPTFFSGHEANGAPAEARHHQHLFYMTDDVDGDGYIDRIAIVAPQRADRSSPPDRRNLFRLARAVDGLVSVRAGALGVVELGPDVQPDNQDPVFGAGRIWVTRTAYQPTRHPKPHADLHGCLGQDVTRECLRRGLPLPEVEVTDSVVGPRSGLSAKLRLIFTKMVAGPLMLGAGSHFGAGVFSVEQ